MKRKSMIRVFISMLAISCFLCACNNTRNKPDEIVESIYGVEEKEEILKILNAYPASVNPNEAIADGLFVITFEGVNADSKIVWDTFYEEVQQGKDTSIIIVEYTIEGDTLLTYISFKGGSFYSILDVSRDKFSAGEAYYDGSYQFLKIYDYDAGSGVLVLLTNFDYASYEDFDQETLEDITEVKHLFFMGT
jgi:hypothetical protein